VTYPDERIAALAVVEIGGSATSVREFGVGRMTYRIVPLPAAVWPWLLGTSFLGYLGIGYTRRNQA
jgi:hypothetical protein